MTLISVMGDYIQQEQQQQDNSNNHNHYDNVGYYVYCN